MQPTHTETDELYQSPVCECIRTGNPPLSANFSPPPSESTRVPPAPVLECKSESTELAVVRAPQTLCCRDEKVGAGGEVKYES
jgi:hypothetical protein